MMFLSLILLLQVILRIHGDDGTCSCDGCTAVCTSASAACANSVLEGTLGSCSAGDSTLECNTNTCDFSTEGVTACADFCSSAGSGCSSSEWSCSTDRDVCFHEETEIVYKGVSYSMNELLNGAEPECVVPHAPSCKGLVISSSCGKDLRVTESHLISTSTGFKAANLLIPGDVLYSDLSNQKECFVSKVTPESSTQKYFGLNCLHSEVIANGIHTSTFGEYHFIPSFYMAVVGRVFGVEQASSLGSTVAKWFYGE